MLSAINYFSCVNRRRDAVSGSDGRRVDNAFYAYSRGLCDFPRVKPVVNFARISQSVSAHYFLLVPITPATPWRDARHSLFRASRSDKPRHENRTSRIPGRGKKETTVGPPLKRRSRRRTLYEPRYFITVLKCNRRYFKTHVR